MDDDDFNLDDPEELCKPFEKAQEMYHNLQTLEYEDEFLKISRLPALHRLYFMVETNSGEQYYNFVLLAAWLIRKCGKNIELPEEADDPNTVISNILGIVRQMGGVVDFSPSKVKSGCGPEVVHVLLFLSEKAIETLVARKELELELPAPVIDSKDDLEEELEEEMDDELEGDGQTLQELDMEKVEEEMQHYYSSDDDDEPEVNLNWIPAAEEEQKDIFKSDAGKEKLKILESNTDAEEWRLELERVLPQLKVVVKPETHDWRWRYEQMEGYTKGISEVLEQIENPLEKIMSETKSVSEKVQSRESYLSSQVEDLLKQLSTTQEKIIEVRGKHRQQGTELGNKNKLLSKLNDDVEETRRQLDDRGTVMADGAPVNQVRKALSTLKKEMGDMEVEIGVMEHCVLKTLIQEQTLLRDKASNI